MRITFVLPDIGLSGGIRVVAAYAQRLQQRGHAVTVVSTPWVPPGRRAQAWHRVRQWVDRLNPLTDPAGRSHMDGIAVEHRELRKRHVADADVPDADVVVATWWETAHWVADLAHEKGAKAYFIQHYEVHDGQPQDEVKATWTYPMHKIVVAQWLADIARHEFGDHEVSVVPNSVDLQLFHAPPRGKQPVPTVGMMYTSRPYKGCDISIEAFERARRVIPDLQLVAFGVEDMAVTKPALPADTLYRRSPAQDQLRGLYSRCDAWLFGSRVEGFGLPILEAMACRTPVIGTPTGAAPELLRGGGGVLVPPEDPVEMADAIVRLVNLPDSQWREMSRVAHATATRYTWDDATTLFEQALTRAKESSALPNVVEMINA